VLDEVGAVSVKDCFRFQTVDLAASKKSRADWTVISTWDVTRTEEPCLILVDRIRLRLEAADHLAVLEQSMLRMKPRYAGVEKATYGLSLLQAAVRRGLSVRPLDPDRDKVARAIPAGQMVDQHRVFFPRQAPWLDEWEGELLAFPGSTYDDQVDTLAYAVLEVNQRRFKRHVSEPEPEGMEQKIWAQLKRDKRRRGAHPVLGRW
jgi:predicted phage terminase large subunit-like protein